MESGKVTYPSFTDKVNGDHRTDREFGHAHVENGVLKSAKSLRLHYYLRQDTQEYTDLSIVPILNICSYYVRTGHGRNTFGHQLTVR
jgi:hypothetical protein